MINFKFIIYLAVLSLVMCLTLANANFYLEPNEWLQATFKPDNSNINQMVFHYSFLSRLVMSLLVGAGLGITGLLFQQVLRNPLAEPTTLGIANGAQLGITIASLWGESLVSTQTASIIGSLLLGGIVLSAVWRKKLSPFTLILSGLVLTLYCSSISQLIGLYYHERLQSVLLWGTGNLSQMNWSRVTSLFPVVLICFFASIILLRPLNLLGLDDSIAKNLGLYLSLSRFVTLFLAIILSAFLVNAAGIIGFIGLFAPILARLLGARRLFSRFIMSAAVGSLLLWFSDQVVFWITVNWREMSTGTVTAVIGAPVLMMLLPRLKNNKIDLQTVATASFSLTRRNTLLWTMIGALLIIILFYVSLSLGRNGSGWSWATGDHFSQLLPYRLPRTLAALCAGGMLAAAGLLVQKLTANPVSSPEVLGMSSGASLGVVLLLLVSTENISGWLIFAGCAGSLLSLVLIITLSGFRAFSPKRMLLGGMALNTAFTAILMLTMASGDPRVSALLTWFAGSTYGMTASRAIQASFLAILFLLCTSLCIRWLKLLPLGEVVSRAVGLHLTLSRISIMLLAAALTATSTFLVGPLSFIGLMAPHMARMFGFRHTFPQLIIAILCGSGLMLLADWAGRMIVFPYQLPAGLLAALLGVPFFLWQLRKY